MVRLLITDDSGFLRKKIKHALKDEGYSIQEATNGRECVELCQEEPPNCLLLDLLMPEMNGIDVLHEFQNQHVIFPIIVLTADIQDPVREECLSLGAFAFLNKPFKDEELRETVRNALVSVAKD